MSVGMLFRVMAHSSFFPYYILYPVLIRTFPFYYQILLLFSSLLSFFLKQKQRSNVQNGVNYHVIWEGRCSVTHIQFNAFYCICKFLAVELKERFGTRNIEYASVWPYSVFFFKILFPIFVITYIYITKLFEWFIYFQLEFLTLHIWFVSVPTYFFLHLCFILTASHSYWFIPIYATVFITIVIFNSKKIFLFVFLNPSPIMQML